jgi:hypothetical protein
MSALRDFEDEFESLRANLEAAIWRAVGSFDEINDLLKAAEAEHHENVVSVVLDQQSIETLRAVRDDVAETISALFELFGRHDAALAASACLRGRIARANAHSRFMKAAGLTFRAAIALLRDGGLLYLTYIRNQPVWDLNGFGVAPEVVSLLLACGDVEPAGDGLFAGVPCQTWRLRK